MSGSRDGGLRSRDALLETARRLASACGEQAARQATAALAILRASGMAELLRALDPNVQLLLGASSKHWDRFRQTCGGQLRALADQGDEAMAFVLGWVKRLALVTRRAGRAGGPP